MLFVVKRNPLSEPLTDFEWIEVLLQKPSGNYLCHTNLGYFVLEAEAFEMHLEAMLYVAADATTEEVRVQEHRRAVMKRERAEDSKSQGKRKAAQRRKAG
jgi:hypothetical protein